MKRLIFAVVMLLGMVGVGVAQNVRYAEFIEPRVSLVSAPLPPRTITDDGINIALTAGPSGKITLTAGATDGIHPPGDVEITGSIGLIGTSQQSGNVRINGGPGAPGIGNQGGTIFNQGGNATGNSQTGSGGNSGGSVYNFGGVSFNHEGGNVRNVGGDCIGFGSCLGGRVTNRGGNCFVPGCQGGPNEIYAGHSFAAGNGGPGGIVEIRGGNASGDGTVARAGGYISIISGDGFGPGGDILLRSGAGRNGSPSGVVSFVGGVSLTPGGSATGGAINFKGGDGANSGIGSPGGGIEFTSGSGTISGFNNAGDIRFRGGNSPGQAGNIVFISGNGSNAGIMRFIVGTHTNTPGDIRFDFNGGSLNVGTITSSLVSFSIPVKATEFRVGNNKVVGSQCAAIPDATSETATATINAVLACMRAHGLVAQ